MYHHTAAGGGGATPFSPQHQQQQMMMMMQQQPLSQQMQQQQPLSNAPATPATPQQQPLSMGGGGGPASVHTLQQPSSVQHQQQPGSVGMPTPSTVGIYSVGPGPGSNPPPASSSMAAGPFSNQQQTPQLCGPSSTATTATAPSSGGAGPVLPAQTQGEHDPISAAKALILKDLRRSIMNLNQCAERVVDCYANPQQQQPLQKTETSVKHEERKPMGTGGGPHSNLGLAQGGPHSNLGLVGPHSVQTPLSVPNPQSVNPQSVTAMAPGSVKSTGEEQTTGSKERVGEDQLSVSEQYEAAKNQFMSVCDNIERNMHLVLEVHRQQGKLYNQQTNSAVAWGEHTGQFANASTTLPQMVRGYTELMNADKQAIRASIAGLDQLLTKLGGKKQ